MIQRPNKVVCYDVLIHTTCICFKRLAVYYRLWGQKHVAPSEDVDAIENLQIGLTNLEGQGEACWTRCKHTFRGLE